MATKVGLLGAGSGSGPHKLIDASSSTGEGNRLQFPAPMSRWGLQVSAGSTDAQVLLRGSIASSSETAGLTTLLTWDADAGQADGDIVWAVDKPCSEVVAVLNAGASSDGATAWITATP